LISEGVSVLKFIAYPSAFMRAKSLQSGEKGLPSGFLTFAERRDVPYVGGGDANTITIPNVSHGFFTSLWIAGVCMGYNARQYLFEIIGVMC
jgi:hypothetical protein